MISCDETTGEALLALAREHLELELDEQRSRPLRTARAAAFRRLGCSFVTLRLGDELRGCIGSLEASRPLDEDVCGNALAAARNDPRFAPVTAKELPRLTIEVSVLTTPETLSCSSEPQLLALLRPGVDGLVVSRGSHRGTLLPQIWETLPDPRDFVAAVWEKAGLEPHSWSADLQISRYEVTSWSEAH